MAALSSTLAWKIPWTKEPGELQSLGPQRAGPDWATEHKQKYTTEYYSATGNDLEKGVAAHSSILAWRIPWTEEPGGL